MPAEEPASVNGFPFCCPVEVRYSDVDAMNHVNNAVTVSYLEVARVKLWRSRFAFRGGAADFPFIVARIEVDYRSPIELGDTVVVGLGVPHIGRTSFTFAYRIEASGRLAAEARSVQVVYDYARSAAAPIPGELRERLAALTLPGRPR